MAEEGGLIAYGPPITQMFRELVARQLIKLFRGVKPADLPVEQPTRFELVINLQAAKAIGHEVPAGLVLRADKSKTAVPTVLSTRPESPKLRMRWSRCAHSGFVPGGDIATCAASIDHLVGAYHERQWHIDTQCLRGREIDHELANRPARLLGTRHSPGGQGGEWPDPMSVDPMGGCIVNYLAYCPGFSVLCFQY